MVAGKERARDEASRGAGVALVLEHVTSVKSSPTYFTRIGQVYKKTSQSGKCSL